MASSQGNKSIFIAPEILDLLVQDMSAHSLCSFYAAICLIPGSQETQECIGNIIVSRCIDESEKYLLIDQNKYLKYRKVLVQFCTLRKNAHRMISGIRETLLPLYLRVLKESSFSTRPSSLDNVRVCFPGYIDSLGKTKLMSILPPKGIKHVFRTGNRELLHRISQEIRSHKKETWINLRHLLKHACSYEPAFENFSLIIGKVHIKSRKFWIGVLKECCEYSLDEKVLDLVLLKVGKLNADETSNLRLCSIKSGIMERIQRFGEITREDAFTLFHTAAQNGHLNLLKEAEKLKPVSKNSVLYALNNAIWCNRIEILEYLHEKYQVFDISCGECIRYYLRHSPDEFKSSGCFHYMFSKCHPPHEKEAEGIGRFLERIKIRDIDMLQFVYRKFGKFIRSPILLIKSASRNRLFYDFCRDQIGDLAGLTKTNCIDILISTAYSSDDVDLFLYVKSDLTQRVPKFRKWWPQIKKQVLDFLPKDELEHILEYFLAETMNQEERNAYFIEAPPEETFSDNYFRLAIHYTTNIQEIIAVCNKEVADKFLDILKNISEDDDESDDESE